MHRQVWGGTSCDQERMEGNRRDRKGKEYIFLISFWKINFLFCKYLKALFSWRIIGSVRVIFRLLSDLWFLQVVVAVTRLHKGRY